jgi:hypothetical protein
MFTLVHPVDSSRKPSHKKVKHMFRHPSRLTVSVLFVCAMLALREARPLSLADRASTLAIEPLTSPAGANTAEPQFTVQGDRAILSWLEVVGKRATLTFAERTASGWSEARTVASGNDFFVNAADVPSVRALADGTLVGQWLQQNGPDPDAYNVSLSWSKDGGRTWSPPTAPHHDGTKTQHGFVSLFQAPGAGLGLVWLDGRATNPATESGNMSLRASVYDPGGKQLREMLVDSRVCDCCSTSVAQTADGAIVAYRDRSAGEVRDIAVSRFAAGRWSMPVAVHHDGWRIEACPINGPAISARGRDVAVAWFTAPTEIGHTFVAFSHDAGRTFGPPVGVDDGKSLGRVSVDLLDDGSAAVSWTESATPRPKFKVRTVLPGGERSAAVTVAETTGNRYPRLAHVRNELIFAWTDTEGDGTRIRTARTTIRGK